MPSEAFRAFYWPPDDRRSCRYGVYQRTLLVNAAKNDSPRTIEAKGRPATVVKNISGTAGVPAEAGQDIKLIL